MESASIPVRPSRSRADVAREVISKYGLIAILLVLPVAYGIQDLQDEGSLTRLATNIKDGLSNGAIWALIAVGYTLVYGIIELINFAHGDLFMIGSFVAYSLIGTIGLTVGAGTAELFFGLLLILFITMIATGTLNTMIERVAYRPLRNAPKLAPLITAVGFSFILQNIGLLWLGGSHRGVPDLINTQEDYVTIFGVPITHGDLLALVVTVPLFFFLINYISRSRMGRAMRATAQDPQAARLMGINVDTTISFTFLLGGLMAGAAGLIYALYQTDVWFFSGFTAGPDRLHRRGHGRHRQHQGRHPRRPDHRLHPADLRQPHRDRVDAGDRLRLSRADPRVPAAGPARRGDEGGRMSTETPRMATKPRGLKLPRKVGPFELSTIVAAVAILVAIFVPFYFDSGSGFMNDATVALVYVVMALGLNIVVGFAGLLDLGYVAFFAIGAYTMGWLGSTWFSGESIHIGVAEQLSSQPGIHLNWLIVLPIAAIAAATLGAILGFPTLRLRGDYIAIVTLAFGEIIGRVAVNSDDGVFGIGHFNLTNGRAGITPVDKIDIPLVERFTTLNLRPWYWTALALALVVLFINFRLRDSRIGRAWIAIREDEVAAVSMGIPTVRVKLLAYALGAAMGGMAGTFLGSFYNTVNADQFEFSFSIFVLAMIILGGLGSIWGVVVGALLLSYINTNLIPDVLNDVPSKIGLDFDVTELGFGIFGFLLVIMMVLRPQGLIPERRHQAEFDVAEPTEGGDFVVETRA